MSNKPNITWEIIFEEFMKPLGVTTEKFCDETGFDIFQFCEMSNSGKMSTKLCNRLTAYFGLSEGYFMRLDKVNKRCNNK
jgi:plasmid maintenance system antidote protein VapI